MKLINENEVAVRGINNFKELNITLSNYLNTLYDFTEDSPLQLIVGKLKDDLDMMNSNASSKDIEFILSVKN